MENPVVNEEYYYDKRHLFRMAEEDKHFSAGDKRLIVPYKGWNICLQVCYDLRGATVRHNNPSSLHGLPK